jgi:hypothetical protein
MNIDAAIKGERVLEGLVQAHQVAVVIYSECRGYEMSQEALKLLHHTSDMILLHYRLSRREA